MADRLRPPTPHEGDQVPQQTRCQPPEQGCCLHIHGQADHQNQWAPGVAQPGRRQPPDQVVAALQRPGEQASTGVGWITPCG
jgi:hypothetical protein